MDQKKKPMRPEEIVDLNIDYYAVLGLTKGDLPEGVNREEKIKISDILSRARRACSKDAHPDLGGSIEAFRLLIQAEHILGDPILRLYYESGGAWRPSLSGAGSDFEVDWDSLGTYRKGSVADTVGFSFFSTICGPNGERAKALNLIPAHMPRSESDNYEWDFIIYDELEQLSSEDGRRVLPRLAVSLVYDVGEVARLTSGEAAQKEDTQPFKIYICIPRASLHYLRAEKERFELENGEIDEFNGKLLAAVYADYDLLETTSLNAAIEFLTPGGQLETILAQFRDGSLKAQQSEIDRIAATNTWIDTQEMIKQDRDILKAIMNAKKPTLIRNPHAADFLKDLPANDF